MNITIKYCVVWNYKPKAASLAAKIKEKTGVDAAIAAGKTGQFDVIVDGETIFSKDKTGRFPEHDEVLSKLPRAG